MKECKVIPFPAVKLETAEDHNCESIAEGVSEHHDLYAIRLTLISIDRQNGILGDDPVINHGLKLVDRSMEKNEKQIGHSRTAQAVFDEVQRFTNVVTFRQKNRPPLKAA